MNLSRCENGHFYDREKYETCPHCAMGKNRDESLTTIFDNSGNNEIDATMPLTGENNPQMNNSGNIGMPNQENNIPNQSVNPMYPTGLQGQKNINSFGNGGYADETETLGGQSGVPNSNISEIPTTDSNNFIPNPKPAQFGQDDDDSTVAYWDYEDLFSAPQSVPTNAKAVERVSNSTQKHTAMSPCAGWVIALNGNHFGQDFRLKVGKNFVGRDSSMDVALEGDKSVSRNKHAILVYEPKQHLYLVQPGESSELVYLNNEVVLSPVKLKAYDVITIGEVNLLFMPLCGDMFSWSDYLGKGRR